MTSEFASVVAGPPLGGVARALRVADELLVLDGLDEALAGVLEARWGPYLEAAPPGPASWAVRLRRREGEGFIAASPGELYRIELREEGGRRVVVSYNFVLAEAGRPGQFAAAVRLDGDEPPGRVLDNLARSLVARMAVARGGFAMHGAGILVGEQAFIFAGPSNSGKTTAVGLAAPTASLGDDFAVTFPGDGGWQVPGLPFDNAERVLAPARPGPHPLAAILRLVQAPEHRLERPPAALAVAALMGCVAFPWTMPEAGEALLEAVSRLVADGRFARLHFAKDSGFRPLLRSPAD